MDGRLQGWPAAVVAVQWDMVVSLDCTRPGVVKKAGEVAGWQMTSYAKSRTDLRYGESEAGGLQTVNLQNQDICWRYDAKARHPEGGKRQ